MSLGELPKGTAEILLYSIDWESWLDGDTIATSTWTVDTGVTVVASSKTSTVATIKISGGTAGTAYTITNTIVTTTSTETKDEDFELRIE